MSLFIALKQSCAAGVPSDMLVMTCNADAEAEALHPHTT